MRVLSLLYSLAILGIPYGVAGAEGTPEFDAVVAADGSGDHRTIQAAVMAAPYSTAERVWKVRVKAGTYHERVYVQRERGYIRLVGEGADTTRLTHGVHANMTGPDGKPVGTFATPTLQIDGDGFEIENLTVENAAGPVGQALALRVDGDKVVFRNCRFLGWQDTIFLNRGRQYFENCHIEGHVDFIFGGAAAWFENCRIHCLKDGYITAASTPPGDAFGFVFHRCRLTGESGVKTYLGRPWRAHAMTAFLDCSMDEVVRPVGWHNWGDPEKEKTVRYAEFRGAGPGGEAAGRVPWSKQLTPDEAAAVTVAKVLGGDDAWSPAAPADR